MYISEKSLDRNHKFVMPFVIFIKENLDLFGNKSRKNFK